MTPTIAYDALAAILLLFGVVYLARGRLMPYHEAFLGSRHEELPPRVAQLFGLALRLVGSSFFATGAGVLALTHGGPLAASPGPTRVAVAVLVLPPLLFSAYTSWVVGAKAPQLAVGVTLLALLVGSVPYP